MNLAPDHLVRIIETQNQLVAEPLGLDRIMERVARAAVELTGADGATVEVADDGDLIVRTVVGADASLAGIRLPMDASLSGFSVQGGDALCSDDALTDPRVDRDAAERSGTRSLACLPFRDGSGVLKVFASEPSRFSDETVAVLGLLSEVLAAHMARGV